MSLPAHYEVSLARLLLALDSRDWDMTMTNTALFDALQSMRSIAPEQISEITDAVAAKVRNDAVPTQLKALILEQVPAIAQKVRHELASNPVEVVLDRSQLAAIAEAIACSADVRRMVEEAVNQRDQLMAAHGDLMTAEYRQIAKPMLDVAAVLADAEVTVKDKGDRLVAMRARAEVEEAIALLKGKTRLAEDFEQIFAAIGSRAEHKERVELLLRVFFLITERL
jgi:hypothetical protein